MASGTEIALGVAAVGLLGGLGWMIATQAHPNPRSMTPAEREMVVHYIRMSAGHTYYLSTDEIDRLVAKIESTAPATLTTTLLRRYALSVGRNWAASQHRRQAVRVRTSQREEKKRQEQLEREERARQKEDARAEFFDLLVRLAPTLTPLQLKWLGVIRLSVFEGLRDPELADRFPGTTRDVRYQWKHRGIEFLRRYASANLMNVLDSRGGYRAIGAAPHARDYSVTREAGHPPLLYGIAQRIDVIVDGEPYIARYKYKNLPVFEKPRPGEPRVWEIEAPNGWIVASVYLDRGRWTWTSEVNEKLRSWQRKYMPIGLPANAPPEEAVTAAVRLVRPEFEHEKLQVERGAQVIPFR